MQGASLLVALAVMHAEIERVAVPLNAVMALGLRMLEPDGEKVPGGVHTVCCSGRKCAHPSAACANSKWEKEGEPEGFAGPSRGAAATCRASLRLICCV